MGLWSDPTPEDIAICPNVQFSKLKKLKVDIQIKNNAFVK